MPHQPILDLATVLTKLGGDVLAVILATAEPAPPPTRDQPVELLQA